MTEDIEEIKASCRLVPAEGLDTLQYMDAFRRVDDKLGARGTPQQLNGFIALQLNRLRPLGSHLRFSFGMKNEG